MPLKWPRARVSPRPKPNLTALSGRTVESNAKLGTWRPSTTVKGRLSLAGSHPNGYRWRALNPRAVFQFVTFHPVATTCACEIRVGYLEAASIHQMYRRQHLPCVRDRRSCDPKAFAGAYPSLYSCATQSKLCDISSVHVACRPLSTTVQCSRLRFASKPPPRWKVP